MGLPESCQPQQLALFVIVNLSMEFLAMLTGYGTILYGVAKWGHSQESWGIVWTIKPSVAVKTSARGIAPGTGSLKANCLHQPVLD
ncbi:MAG: hypothetical protein AAF151_04470 [Cyanobacteria bacterium J06656_5]